MIGIANQRFGLLLLVSICPWDFDLFGFMRLGTWTSRRIGKWVFTDPYWK
jgi:hypothetical protein